MQDMRYFHDKHLCANCGRQNQEHRFTTGACPSGKFPTFPQRDDARAVAKYDQKIKEFWANSKGVFKAV